MNALASRLSATAGAAFLLALAACQGPETPVSTPESHAAASEHGTILFSESFSDAGSFQILGEASGGYNAIVQAGIGTESERLLVESSVQPTLADVYRSLHGGAEEVPAAVARASAYFAGREPATRGIAPSPAPLGKTASQSAFQSTLCRNFLEGSWKWNVSRCVWDGSLGQSVLSEPQPLETDPRPQRRRLDPMGRDIFRGRGDDRPAVRQERRAGADRPFRHPLRAVTAVTLRPWIEAETWTSQYDLQGRRRWNIGEGPLHGRFAGRRTLRLLGVRLVVAHQYTDWHAGGDGSLAFPEMRALRILPR